MKRNKCQSCIFWTQTEQNEKDYGDCLCPKIVDSDDRDKTATDQLIHSDYEYKSLIKTGKDFGCIHHQKAPKE